MKNLIITLLAALVCAGCSNMMVPKTVLDVPLPNGQVAHYSGPKNTQLEGLELVVNSNGVAKFKVAKATTTMDPQVISMSSQAFNSAIDAIGAQVGRVAQMALMAANTNLLANTNWLAIGPSTK